MYQMPGDFSREGCSRMEVTCTLGKGVGGRGRNPSKASGLEKKFLHEENAPKTFMQSKKHLCTPNGSKNNVLQQNDLIPFTVLLVRPFVMHWLYVSTCT